MICFFFFKQKTAYEMRISDWSSDVCSSDLIPGFGLTMGLTIAWLSLIVLIPLSSIFLRAAGMGWADFVAAGFSPRAIAAYKVSFGTALIAALVNALFGLLKIGRAHV